MKKIILILLILAGQIVMAAKIDNIEVNGIKIPLIYEQDNRLPLANMQLIFTNSGSIADGKKAGLAKLSAQLMNEGTKKLGSNGFAELLESKAIHISASTGTETFVIEVSSLKDEYKTSLKYLKNLLDDPNYSKNAFSKIQTMALGSLSRKENDFDYVANNALKSILFKGTVLAESSSGTKESLASMQLDDIQKFIKTHLVLSRAIVVVGGDVALSDVKKNVQKLLKDLPVGKSEKLVHVDVTQKPQTVVLKKETQQAYIYFGSPYNMAVNSPDYYKARVTTFILGTGGFGSRLMEEIRVKRGLAYSAYARVHISNSASYLTGYLQTKLDSMDEAKATVSEVFNTFVKEGVTQEELDQTKKFLLGSEPLRVETMSQRLNRTFLDYYQGFELGHAKAELQKIKNLKLDDLNEYIKKHKEILNLSFAIVTK